MKSHPQAGKTLKPKEGEKAGAATASTLKVGGGLGVSPSGQAIQAQSKTVSGAPGSMPQQTGVQGTTTAGGTGGGKEETEKGKKKEETSEERFKNVAICDEESNNLQRVFNLFLNEQRVVAREGRGKKEHGKEGKATKTEEISWFDSKSVRGVLAKLGVKEIREHDIDIMIWVGWWW